MQITKVICPTDKYPIKCPDKTTMEGITVHNTANDASAMAEISYMLGRPDKVSFHAAVDNCRVVEGLPFDRSCYAAGDGRYGFGNAKTINIEICYSKSGGDNFIEAEKLAAEYIAMLLKQYGWGIDRVRTHQSWSGKYCPHRTLDYGWERFLNIVKEYYDGSELQPTPTPSPEPTPKQSGNDTIKGIQQWLNDNYNTGIAVDGYYGSQTKKALVKALQTEFNRQFGTRLAVDGIFGEQSKNACRNIKQGAKGNITRIIQSMLYCKGYNTNGIEGIFGQATDGAVRRFQANSGLNADGVVGKLTFAKLFE